MTPTQKLRIGTNLKMYKTSSETRSYLADLGRLVHDLQEELVLFVIPSYTALESAAATVAQSGIALGAQNMHWEDNGEYTGEISPRMLTELGISIAEIGHSERRAKFGETDEDENQKLLAALRHRMTALLCIGETEHEKRLGTGDDRLRQQLKAGLHGVSEDDCDRLWIAYEPVWSIGNSGTPASPNYASRKHSIIRQTVLHRFPNRGHEVPILYGGSVNPANASDLLVQPCIDGLFVGRSAWDAFQFNNLIRQVLPIWKSKAPRDSPGAAYA